MTISNADAIEQSPVHSGKEFIVPLFVSTRIDSTLQLLATKNLREIGVEVLRPSHL